MMNQTSLPENNENPDTSRIAGAAATAAVLHTQHPFYLIARTLIEENRTSAVDALNST